MTPPNKAAEFLMYAVCSIVLLVVPIAAMCAMVTVFAGICVATFCFMRWCWAISGGF